jgi:hypothetical protein
MIGLLSAIQSQNSLKWEGVQPLNLNSLSGSIRTLLHDSTFRRYLDPANIDRAMNLLGHPINPEQIYFTKTKYLFVVTTDGLRWQEVFTGADSTILANHGFTTNPDDCRSKYWAPTPQERRQKLMPFFWSVLAAKGQIYGNRAYGNEVNVANSVWLSYPGYNELFTGNPDDQHIHFNKKVNNPNTNVLEFLNKRKGLRHEVVSFTSWDVFPYILNEKRSTMTVNAAWENVSDPSITPYQRILNKQQHEQPKQWDHGVRLDFMTYAIAKAYVKSQHPKVTFISFDETDEYAHAGKYGPYLDAAHEVDAKLAELWDMIQHDPVYKNQSALIVTVDHGRGASENGQWCHHGPKVAGADQIWFAVVSPDTDPTGEQKTAGRIWQKQLAQTMAALLGYHFHCEHPVGDKVETCLNGSGFRAEPRVKQIAQITR